MPTKTLLSVGDRFHVLRKTILRDKLDRPKTSFLPGFTYPVTTVSVDEINKLIDAGELIIKGPASGSDEASIRGRAGGRVAARVAVGKKETD